ncbi:MAG: flagellar export protein FliJ [Pirellulales bacterium]|nr:flagellar export protein FliJ [Pirellulales bacterium]
MSEFRFKLAALLMLRQSARDECRLLLAESLRADDDLRDRLERLEAEAARMQGRRRAASTGQVDVERVVETERYAALLESEKERLRRRREALAVEIERGRDALLKADQEVRGLEMLRERQLLRHRREQQRRESKQIDECVHIATAKRA